MQSKQIDSKNIWADLENKIIFKNFKDLEIMIDKLINNVQLSNSILLNISKNFENSQNLIENNFDQIFEKNLKIIIGGPARTRTWDQYIMSVLL